MYEYTLYKPDSGLIEMNSVSSDVCSGKSSHFNAGIVESISTKRKYVRISMRIKFNFQEMLISFIYFWRLLSKE